MACSFLHHHHRHFLFSCHFSLNNCSNLPGQTVSQSRCFTKCANHVSSRFRRIQRLSATEGSSDVPRKANSLVTDDRDSGSECDPDPGPELDDVSGGSVSKSISAFVHRLGSGFKLDGLGMEILSIALPATLALAADPIASLVDTAYVGHLGSAELAAVGVSGAVFNLVSKLFNVPLLNITTSFVAEEQASFKNFANDSHQTGQEQQSKMLLPSVSTSIMLAAALGIIETVVLCTGSSFLLNSIAEQFLTLRAFGAPPIVVALAAQGTFRGFKDTKTPLFAVGVGNLLNAILDPLLIFLCGLGVGGAAMSTVISEYLIAVILLWKLNDEVLLIAPRISGHKMFQYLKSGALLTGRTIAVLMTTTLATSMAAHEGPIQMAGHQICFQVWLALSLLNDGLALAGQALLASDYSQGNYGLARQLVYKVLQVGLIMGLALAVILFFGFGALSSLFSPDSEVLGIARSGTLFVAGSQPMNAIAFVLDGLYYGVSDFGFAAYSMALVGLISSVFILMTVPLFGLAGVWSGLFLFMTLRVLAGVFRLSSRSGPWKLLFPDNEKDNT